MSKWKTMESAPRDGTDFIACDEFDVMEFCRYLNEKCVVAWNHDEFRDPVLWRPVPKLPKEFRK